MLGFLHHQPRNQQGNKQPFFVLDFKCRFEGKKEINHNLDHTDRSGPHSDSSLESFWLLRDEEYDMWDCNAIYECKDTVCVE